MIVVSNTSPLIALANIDHLHILPSLFGTVLIPTRVAAELASPARPLIVRGFVATAPTWLAVRQVSHVLPIPKLHSGEQEVIALALEVTADLILIDERDGWRAATARGIATIRTAALLAQAAGMGLIDLREAFDRLRRTDFRVPGKALDRLLQEHLERKTQRG
jgi:predicted nucleic acid-binding protein